MRLSFLKGRRIELRGKLVQLVRTPWPTPWGEPWPTPYFVLTCPYYGNFTVPKPQQLFRALLLQFPTTVHCSTLKVKIFVQWPFGDQLFGFSQQGKFLGAKLY